MAGEKMSVANAARTVQKIKLAELDESGVTGRKLLGDNIELIRNVRVRLTVLVGQSEVTVKDLFDLKENAVLSLDRSVREPVDVLLDGKVVARGNLVAVGENFGVQISEILAS
jgi:flagellar motor switch protein FliN/FliY